MKKELLLTGDTSKIFGDKSKIWGNASKISGCVSRISGCVTGISGCVTNIRGCVDNISGCVTNISGCVDIIIGDVTGISGCVDNIRGDVLCKDCINFIRDINAKSWTKKDHCAVKSIEYVDGKMINYLCMVKNNNGKCPDYKDYPVINVNDGGLYD